VKELKAVGLDLQTHAKSNATTVNPWKVWTEYVLDWFAATAPKGTAIDARRPLPEPPDWRKILGRAGPPTRSTRGEFLVDLAHTTFPDYVATPYDTSYYQTAVKQPCRVRLALESEWGSVPTPGLNYHRVLEDAAKLAVLRADVKVINFGIRDERARDVLVAALAQLRRQAGDDAPWLWVAVPHRPSQEWTPVSDVIKS